MKKRYLWMVCLIMTAMLAACGQKQEDNAQENNSSITEESETGAENGTENETEEVATDVFDDVQEEKEEMEEAFFQADNKLEEKIGDSLEDVIKKSLVSVGNTYRLNKALDKATAGEEVTVAYIGGSVTEGAEAVEKTPEGFKKGYAYLSYEYIRDEFGTGDNVKYVNAGVSGTPSELGVLRCDIDVLEYYPDIIFIEFAVNNGSTDTDKATYESLIRKCLKAENEPAVILLMSAATYSGYTQSYMIKMGEYYKLPILSMHNALEKVLADKVIEWKDFSCDTVHPIQDGHALYAKAISYLINEANKKRTDGSYEIPELATVSLYSRFENSVLIDNQDWEGLIADTGSFTKVRVPFSATGQSHNHALENGFLRNADAGNEPLVLNLECRNFTIVTKMLRQEETSLDVYVDGEFVKSIQTSTPDSWTNPVPYLIIDEAESKMHEIKIYSSKGSEDSAQAILGMSYNK